MAVVNGSFRRSVTTARAVSGALSATRSANTVETSLDRSIEREPCTPTPWDVVRAVERIAQPSTTAA
jgi:hypothetical protein